MSNSRQTKAAMARMFAVVGVLLAGSASAQVTQTTLDSTDAVGLHTSVAIGADGLGLIAYHDLTNGDLKVAHCSDLACSAATISTLDSTGIVGAYTSVTIGADGLGLISYYDGTNLDLKVAHCTNVLCTAATVSTVDSAGTVGAGTSIATGTDGLGLIAYTDTTNSQSKVAHCVDVACTSVVSRVVSTASFGQPIRLIIGSDGLGLMTTATSPVQIIHCSDVPCTSSTVKTSVSSNGGGALGAEPAVGADGLPRIAFSNALLPVLLVYKCDDLECTDANTTFGLLENGLERIPRSMAARLGADGKLLVVYEHKPNSATIRDLRIIHCADDLCSGGEITSLYLPSTAAVPIDNKFASLAIGSDGLALIAYFDTVTADLRVVHCGNTTCTTPTLSIADVSAAVVEGQSTPTSALFPVTLSSASSQTVTVDFATANGTATAPADYETATGTLTFLPGETAKSVEVLIPPSATPRSNRTFSVTLSNPSGVTLARATATGTIVTQIPAFSVSSPTVARGSSGSSNLNFVVSLGWASSHETSVRASTIAGGTATPELDFTSKTAVITFAAGETQKTFAVAVAGQPWGEPNETVLVKLTEATGAQMLTDSGVGTISSSVTPVPSIAVLDGFLGEGNTGTSPMVFTVSLAPTSGEPVTVAYQTLNAGATAGVDFESVSGLLTFPPGATTRTIQVPIIGNAAIQSDRSFSLALSSPTNALLARSNIPAVIRDDDLTMTFSGDPTLIGPGGSSTLQWSAPAGATVSITDMATFEEVSVPTAGSRVVAPTSTRSYRLLAYVSGVFASRQVIVNVASGSAVAAPAITAPTAGATILVSGVTFSWTEVSPATNYDLRVFDRNDGRTIFSGSLDGASSTSTLVSLPDGFYTFAVRSCSDSGCGAFATRAFDVARIAPTGRPTITQPPAGASLTQSTQTLTWTSVIGDPRLSELFYEVLLEDLAAGVTSLQITVPHPATSTIFTLESSAQYRLRVRACQAACGPWSDAVTFSMTLPSVPTGTPSSISCQVNGGNSVACTWDSVAGADTYRIQVVQPAPAGPGGGALTVAAKQVSVAAVTLPVPTGQAYVYVAACNGDGCGPSEKGELPINPAGPNPTEANLGTPMAGIVVDGPTVFFSWNRVPGDDGTNTWYRLFVQDLSRQTTALDVRTKNNFYAAFFKAEGARYDARLISNPGQPAELLGPAQGFNVAGASATAPTMVSPTHGGTFAAGNLQLAWTPVPGATLYEYFFAPAGSTGSRGVTPGLFVQVPFRAGPSGQGRVYNAIARACPAGATCVPGSNAGWGPWSNVPGGPGVTSFTVIP